MAKLGMPSVIISFEEAGITAIYVALARGVLSSFFSKK